jgi:hypothetical protein
MIPIGIIKRITFINHKQRRLKVAFQYLNEEMQAGSYFPFSGTAKLGRLKGGDNPAMPSNWVKTATENWMGDLPDTVKLNEISIPGTHDTCALFGGGSAETQCFSLKEQLLAGIRYVDIRCRRSKDIFAIHHGQYYQKLTFGNVLQACQEFLQEHPNECILMRIKEEYKADSEYSFLEIWNKYMVQRGFDNLFYTSTTQDIPRLGQVRGKIFVLEQASIPRKYGIKLNSPDKVEVQDYYKVSLSVLEGGLEKGEVAWPNDPPEVSLPTKKAIIDKYLDKSLASSGNKLILNSLNGQVWIEQVATEMNKHVYERIGSFRSPRNVGVIIMDFPGERLIYRIIARNFGNGFYTTDGKGNINLQKAHSLSSNWDIIVAGNFGGGGTTDDLLFYRRAGGGMGQFYTTDGNGNINLLKAHSMSNNWDIIVAGNFGGGGTTDDLLFYRRAGGGMGQFYTTDGNGNIELIEAHSMSNNWDIIVAGDFVEGGTTDDLLFYRRAGGGMGQFYTTDGKGNIKLIEAHSMSSNWDIIVAGDFVEGGTTDDLLFYRRAGGGMGQFYTTDGKGNIDLKQAHSMSNNWDIILAGNFGEGGTTDDLLFYRRAGGGMGQFYTTDGKGNIKLLKQHPSWNEHWYIIVPGSFDTSSSTDDLLLYQRSP